MVKLLAADRIHEGLFQAAATHALNTMHSFQAQSVSLQVLCSCYAFAVPACSSICSLSEHTSLGSAPTAGVTFAPTSQ